MVQLEPAAQRNAGPHAHFMGQVLVQTARHLQVALGGRNDFAPSSDGAGSIDFGVVRAPRSARLAA